MPYKDPEKAKKNKRRYYQRNKKTLDAANAQWVKDHPKEHRIIQKRYEATEKGKIAVKKKETNFHGSDKHKKIIRRAHLKQVYGLTLEQYDAMVERQGGVCAICGKHETGLHQNGSVKRLAVDHCHTTGRIRGLLCHRCNLGIGALQENVAILRAAIKYLTTYITPGT